MDKLCDLGKIYINDREDLVSDLYLWHRLWCGCDNNEVLDEKIKELLEGKSDDFIEGWYECMYFFDNELFEDLMQQVDPDYGR